jgi:hypothetical protein
MARGTPPGEQPYYVQEKDQEIKRLKADRAALQRILNFLFDTNRDWTELERDELLDLKEGLKQVSKDKS